MPPRVRIIDKDRGLKKFVRRLKPLQNPRSVKVGVQGSAGGESVDVASIHEFGLGDHPERSFIRAWADADKQELLDDERKLAESVIKGTNTAASALEKLGVLFAAKAQKFIQDGRVSPATVKSGDEGSNTTLIDTGQLVSSISHEVE